MKIVVPQINIDLLNDIAQSLESLDSKLGVSTALWNPQYKPTLDMFDELQPDLVFIHPAQIDQSFVVACQEFNFKFIIIGDSWIRDAEENFVSLPKNPSLVMTSPMTSKNFPAQWPTLSPRHGARVAQIHNAKFDPKLESEVLVITSGVEMKGDIETVCHFLTSNYRTKIIGSNGILSHHYLGDVSIFERADFIRSSKVLIDFLGAQCWDAQYLRTAPVCAQNVSPMIVTFRDIASLSTSVDSLLKKPMAYQQYTDACFANVCDGNTYFHVVSEIFDKIGEPDIAQSLKQRIKELIDDRNT